MDYYIIRMIMTTTIMINVNMVSFIVDKRIKSTFSLLKLVSRLNPYNVEIKTTMTIIADAVVAAAAAAGGGSGGGGGLTAITDSNIAIMAYCFSKYLIN